MPAAETDVPTNREGTITDGLASNSSETHQFQGETGTWHRHAEATHEGLGELQDPVREAIAGGFEPPRGPMLEPPESSFSPTPNAHANAPSPDTSAQNADHVGIAVDNSVDTEPRTQTAKTQTSSHRNAKPPRRQRGRLLALLAACIVASTAILIVYLVTRNGATSDSSQQAANLKTDCGPLIKPYLAFVGQSNNQAIRQWQYLPDFNRTRQLLDLPETRVQAATLSTFARKYPQCVSRSLDDLLTLLKQNASQRTVKLEDFTRLVPAARYVTTDFGVPVEFKSDGDTSDWRSILLSLPSDVQVTPLPSDPPSVQAHIDLLTSNGKDATALDRLSGYLEDALLADTDQNYSAISFWLGEIMANQPGVRTTTAAAPSS